MKYCSAYLWEKGRNEEYNPVSLVLQQVQVRKQAVLLGCVCKGAACGERSGVMTAGVERGDAVGAEVEVSGYFTEALVEWFHRECLELLERKCGEAELEKSLQKEVATAIQEIRQFAEKKQVEVCMDAVGILLVEQRFWLFSIGNGQVFLLNRRYNHKHMRQIVGRIKSESEGKEEQGAIRKRSGVNENNVNVHWENGILQKRLGLLLCGKAFWADEKSEEVAEVLLTDGEVKEERLQRRLQELWETRGNREDSVGAVFIRTY